MPARNAPRPALRREVHRRVRQPKYHGLTLVIIVLWCLPAGWITAGLPVPSV